MRGTSGSEIRVNTNSVQHPFPSFHPVLLLTHWVQGPLELHPQSLLQAVASPALLLHRTGGRICSRHQIPAHADTSAGSHLLVLRVDPVLCRPVRRLSLEHGLEDGTRDHGTVRRDLPHDVDSMLCMDHFLSPDPGFCRTDGSHPFMERIPSLQSPDVHGFPGASIRHLVPFRVRERKIHSQSLQLLPSVPGTLFTHVSPLLRVRPVL